MTFSSMARWRQLTSQACSGRLSSAHRHFTANRRHFTGDLAQRRRNLLFCQSALQSQFQSSAPPWRITARRAHAAFSAASESRELKWPFQLLGLRSLFHLSRYHGVGSEDHGSHSVAARSQSKPHLTLSPLRNLFDVTPNASRGTKETINPVHSTYMCRLFSRARDAAVRTSSSSL